MSDKPNVLVIMTDQQRYDTIGALGNSLIQTPALDRLVTGGTSFTSAYCASPVCVASMQWRMPWPSPCIGSRPVAM